MGTGLPWLLLLALAHPPATAQAREHLRLWGQVRLDGQGVPGAEVVVAGRDTCLCDDQGNFSFSDVPAGPLHMRVSGVGLQTLRRRMWLRREAFLPVDMCRLNRLADHVPLDSLRTYPADLALAWDLDSDGAADLWGSRPLDEAVQSFAGGLPVQDGWGGLWPAGGARVQPQLWQPLQPDLSAGASSLEGALVPPGESTDNSVDVEVLSGGATGTQACLRRPLGLWQEAGLQAGVQAAPGNRAGRWLAFDHSWTPLGTLRVEHRAALDQTEWQGLGDQAPRLWWPQASSRAWRDAGVDMRQLSWRTQAHATPARGLELGAHLWWRRRDLNGGGWELDRVLHRLPAADSISALAEAWFPTRRRETRHARGLGISLQQTHNRGRLQGAFLVETQRRQQENRLDSTIWTPAGLHPWVVLEEEQVRVEARLVDQWSLSRVLMATAGLDLRYAFHELQRRPVGWFQLSAVPEVGFNRDLLALEPRLALEWLPSPNHTLQLAWQRRHPLTSPAGMWDLGASVERLLDTPLWVAYGSEEEWENRLPSPILDEVSLRVARSGNLARVRAGIWVRRWQDFPLAGWVDEGKTPDPAVLTSTLDPLQAGLDAGLRLAHAAWRVELDGGWSWTRLAARLWRPLPDSDLLGVRDETLRRLPGEPAWRGRLAGTVRLAWKDLRVEPRLSLVGMGPRDPGNQAGWTRETPASLRLDADVDLGLNLRPGRPSAWGLTVWGRNLGADPHAGVAWVEWRAAERQALRHELDGAGRSVGLRLSWVPAHE
jgi:hypothetical protein